MGPSKAGKNIANLLEHVRNFVKILAIFTRELNHRVNKVPNSETLHFQGRDLDVVDTADLENDTH